MGGLGSGRSGGRPTVESSLALPVRTLLKGRGERREWSGELTYIRNGRPSGSLRFAVRLDPENYSGVVAVRHKRQNPWGELEAPEPYAIKLTATDQPFGGMRWWLICPVSGRHCAGLFLPYRARKFGSREAYRLGYVSQRTSPHDTSIERVRKLRKKIGGGDNTLAPIPSKPKWMRWRTYDRHVAAIRAAEQPMLQYALAIMDGYRKAA